MLESVYTESVKAVSVSVRRAGVEKFAPLSFVIPGKHKTDLEARAKSLMIVN